MFSSVIVSLAIIAVSAAKDSRTFAVNHFYGKGPLVEGRMDPIVSPGRTSAHVHTIQGGNKFALTLSDTDLLSSTCTSSLIQNDKSAYWIPKLYFQDPETGIFTDVPLFYMNVYYFFEATDDQIEAFQPGLRMVIGNVSLRTPPATGGASITDTNFGVPQPVQWTCPRSNYTIPSYPVNSDGLHGVGIQDPNNQGAGVGFPDMNCDGYASPLRADIHFPSCYNPAAGLDNFESNMEFPSSAGTTGGKQNCPSGWIHTPHIFYEVYWNTPLFASRWTEGQGTQPFVLANGDSTGYSLHADFISGWDVATLQQIIDNCDAGDSGMDQCPGLIGGVNDPSTSCNIPSAIQEQITGNLVTLPGDNPVTGAGSSPPQPPPVPSSSTSSVVAGGPTKSSSSMAASSTGYGGINPSSPSLSTSSVGYGGLPTASSSSTSTSIPVAVQSSTSLPIAISDLSATIPVAAKPSKSSPYIISTTSAAVPVVTEFPPSSPAALSTTLATVPIISKSPITSAAAATTPYAGCGPAVTTTITTTIASTETFTSTVAATNIVHVPGWTYAGCYYDTRYQRVLSGVTFADLGIGNVTSTGCIAYCASQGYSIAGTEYAGQCFCGNALVGSQKLAESTCNMPCQGDASQICGGELALSVYEMSESKSESASASGTSWRRYTHRDAHRVRGLSG